MNVAIERELEFLLAVAPRRGIPVPGLLSYRADDPYAVHVTFHTGSDSPVSWAFARDLLVEGLCRPCGQGDVRLWPTVLGGRPVLYLALESLDGDALLSAPAGAVRSWLGTTMHVVPPGSEQVEEALDAELTALLSAARTEEC